MRTTSTRIELSQNVLLLAASLFLVAVGNLSFFDRILKAYPFAMNGLLHYVSLSILLFAINALFLSLVCFGRLTKPLLVVILLLSSMAAYFMDSYGVVISDEMLQNVVQTNPAEAMDLLTTKLLGYILFLGVLPSIAVIRVPLRRPPTWPAFKQRFLLIFGLLVTIAACIAPFTGFYASFIREHKSIRNYANPTYYIYAAGKFANAEFLPKAAKAMTLIGRDASIPIEDKDRELIILVVGETARADHFGLNGYRRDTTPNLRAANAVSFTNFWSCGTSTAVSVPCMFSTTGMNKFDVKDESSRENLLDILHHAGVNVLWLENNSDSKGVATRTEYREFKSPKTNPVCDEECRDEGMLVGLQDYIDSHPTGDIFIVMHQMGNHGPAYYKRYPKSFEKYTPVCKDAELNRCTDEEIVNAYDNALLYTDYFLGKTIDLLKHNDPRFETALIYVSDHGESLGEKGAYLHGLPRSIAPEGQIHVPAALWLGRGFKSTNLAALEKVRDAKLTHDSVVHTILGSMEIQTKEYQLQLDLLEMARRATN